MSAPGGHHPPASYPAAEPTDVRDPLKGDLDGLSDYVSRSISGVLEKNDWREVDARPVVLPWEQSGNSVSRFAREQASAFAEELARGS